MIRILGVILALFRLQTLSAQLAIKIKGQQLPCPPYPNQNFRLLLIQLKLLHYRYNNLHKEKYLQV